MQESVEAEALGRGRPVHSSLQQAAELAGRCEATMKKFAFLYVFGWRPDGVWRFGEPELVAYPCRSSGPSDQPRSA